MMELEVENGHVFGVSNLELVSFEDSKTLSLGFEKSILFLLWDGVFEAQKRIEQIKKLLERHPTTPSYFVSTHWEDPPFRYYYALLEKATHLPYRLPRSTPVMILFGKGQEVLQYGTGWDVAGWDIRLNMSIGSDG